MSQVVVDTDTGEILEDMSADEAWEFVQFIRAAQDEVPRRITDAYNRRAWLALGYASWDEMCVGERLQIRLPRDERPELVLELRAGGMSTRAIASVTGTSKDTVHRDLQPGVSNETPGDDDSDGGAEPEPSEPDPAPVTGLDGKTYTPKAAAEPRKPPRPDINKTFFNAAYDLNRKAEAVSRLVQDDRFGRNKNQLAEKHLHELARTRDLIDEVITHLEG